jgi:hypothetical protein
MTSDERGEVPVIGIDFDNTIAIYDTAFHAAALHHGLIALDTQIAKLPIRDAIRRRTGGELAWQRLQAEVYGPLMPQARLFDGVLAFLQDCQRRRYPVYVVSHKTKFASRDETQTNLRQAALEWMRSQGLLNSEATGLSSERVFFESTRRDKIDRVRQLAFTHFVDDLQEVFLESAFPAEVTRILLTALDHAPNGVHPAAGWDDVARIVFDV